MKLTPDQQMRKALVLLAPPRAKRDQCKRDIEAALENINEGDGLEAQPNSGPVREAVERLLKQLEDCERAYKALFKLDHAHAHELMSPLDLSEQISLYKEWLSVGPGPPRKSAAKQQAAVKDARTLVLNYRGEKEARKTRGNAWHELAAILFGDDQHDLFNHMRKLRPDPIEK